jgi:hypothetical protein
VTDAEGHYRLRGLQVLCEVMFGCRFKKKHAHPVSSNKLIFRVVSRQPGCTYRVRVKDGEMNAHIERSTPQYIDIQVSGFYTLYKPKLKSSSTDKYMHETRELSFKYQLI